MKIPKERIKKKNREYVFVKKINKWLYLYEEVETGYKECFNAYDLGFVKEKVKPATYIKPENVTFL